MHIFKLISFFSICTCASQMSLCFSLFLTLGLLGRLKYNIDQKAGCNSVLISCLPDPKWQWEPVEVVIANVQADLSHNHLRGSANGWVKVKKTSRTKTASLEILFTIALTGKLTWPGGFHQWTSDMQLKSKVNVFS